MIFVLHDPRGASAPFHQSIRHITLLLAWLLFSFVGIISSASASDHADPIDPLNKTRLEGGITDLFVFPVIEVDEHDQPAFPFLRAAGLKLSETLADVKRKEISAEERKKIKALVFILCVRRQLIDSATLQLDPFEYQIHIDLGLEGEKQISFPTDKDFEKEQKLHDDKGDRIPTEGSGYTGHGHSHTKRPTLVEAFARYGGKIPKPEAIEADLTMQFRLTNAADFQNGYPKYSGTAAKGWQSDTNIRTQAGVFEDPFIFPAFFGTNIVGIVVRVPVERFPKNTESMLIWANSWKGNQQVDHVGRSLRTQNPRFELLNTLHPKFHRAAIMEEHNNPSLLRDLALRFNFASMFAYRQWDFEPDVMCYTLKYPVGFPNGRLLSDDVSAILAQHGDTLLYELSYQHNNGDWPRRRINDRVLHMGEKFEFPYLLKPFPNVDTKLHPVQAPGLSMRSILKLLGIVLLILVLFVLENVLFARWYHRRKLRRHYL